MITGVLHYKTLQILVTQFISDQVPKNLKGFIQESTYPKQSFILEPRSHVRKVLRNKGAVTFLCKGPADQAQDSRFT